MLRSALSWKNAWRIRIVTLGLIVLSVGISSQMLVNAIAASSDMVTLKVTASTLIGRMADGNWTYVGACAVSESQFPFGTIIALYNTDGSFNRQCTAEDTNSTINYGQIALAMPGRADQASRWGVQYLSAEVLRLGWDSNGHASNEAASSTPISSPDNITRPRFVRSRSGW